MKYAVECGAFPEVFFVKKWKRLSKKGGHRCGSCAHFVRHYVPLRGPKDNQFIACSCGHCVYRPEEICYTERTAPVATVSPAVSRSLST